MEIRITWLRAGLVCALLIAYYWFGGFTNPADLAPEGSYHVRKITEAWFYTVAMFLAGVACVALIEHEVGILAPINLRFLYVVTGFALMAGSLIWANTLKSAIELPRAPATELERGAG